MYVEIGVKLPHKFLKITTEDEIDTVNSIPHYMEKEDEHNKMGRQREVKDADNIRLKKYLKVKFIFKEDYEENKD